MADSLDVAAINPAYREKLSGASIRLLQISSSHDGGFTGRLHTFRLASAPPFYSASYTWGAKTISDTVIELENGSLPVLRSLVPFLRMISEHDDFSDKDWWWIDSLSINLADGQEREQQVRIMADIYKRARRAIVWLGEEVEEGSDCTDAIEFMYYLSTLALAFDKDNNVRMSLREPSYEENWAAVSKLLARPWWTRVWTLQEFILPREAKIYCGTSSISRSKFKEALYNIFRCSTGFRDIEYDLVPRQVFDTAFNRRRIHQWHRDPQSRGVGLVAIIAYLGNHSASDPRDRIYSVLGLITERDRRLVGPPEYTSRVEWQYAKLVRSFWDEYKSLDIICFSHLFNRYSGRAEPGLEASVPSWTPDWRVHTEYASPVPLMASQSSSEHVGNLRPLHSKKWKVAYDAPGKKLQSSANVRFHENLKEMWCDGVILDTIDTLGGLEGCDPRCKSFICAAEEPIHKILNSDQDSTAAVPANPLDLLEAIARSLVLDRQDKYLCFPAPQHYISDFLILSHACLSTETDFAIEPIFTVWFQQNRTLRLGSYTLESMISTIASTTDPTFFDALPPHRLRPAYSFPYPPHTSTEAGLDDGDTFLSRFVDTVKKKARRVMVTREGGVGMAPCRARIGDAVVVLFGCSVPLVLRKVGSRDAWKVVGEAYVHGYMDGEVGNLLRKGKRNVHKFRLV